MHAAQLTQREITLLAALMHAQQALAGILALLPTGTPSDAHAVAQQANACALAAIRKVTAAPAPDAPMPLAVVDARLAQLHGSVQQ